jgi:hypothetical protein
VTIVLAHRGEAGPALHLAGAAAAIRDHLRSAAEPSWQQRVDSAVAAARSLYRDMSGRATAA